MIDRCPHGNYVPKGERTSPGCTGCHPISVHVRAFAPSRQSTKFIDERTVDAVEYSHNSIGDRMADAEAMEQGVSL